MSKSTKIEKNKMANKFDSQKRVKFSNKLKELINNSKVKGTIKGIEYLEKIEKKYEIKNFEDDVIVSLLLAYRSLMAWNKMISLIEKMSESLLESEMIQEQLAVALNRAGQSEKAERVLLCLIRRGGSISAYGLLGRIYKDRWKLALRSNNGLLSVGLVDKAIDAFLKGFDIDFCDTYCGINLITLMEIRNPPDERIKKILPVVTYAVERRLETNPDFWQYSTLLELAVIAKDEQVGTKALSNTLSSVKVSWELQLISDNLGLIRKARIARGEKVDWANQAEESILKAANKLETTKIN